MKRAALRHAAVALALGLVVGCSHTPPKPVLTHADGTAIAPPPPPSEDDEARARALAATASEKERAGDLTGAQAIEDDVIARFPGTVAAALVFERRAEAALRDGDTRTAVQLYEQLLFYRPDFERAAKAREAYGLALVEVGRYTDAIGMLEPSLSSASGGDKLRLGLPLARALAGARRGAEALELLVDLKDLSGLTPDQRASIDAKIALAMDEGLSFQDTVTVWERAQGRSSWSTLQPVLTFKLAKIYFHMRDFESAERMLRTVTDQYGNSPYAAPARELIVRLADRRTVQPHTLGVVLPLSGRFKQYGERALAAIELALGDKSGLTVIVKDSAGEPMPAEKAVEELVQKHHVIAIIGDAFTAPAMAAARKAEDLGVPLLSLAFGEGIPEVGPAVFRLALTVEAQAEALAEVAMKELGMSRFALLYPRTRYGVDFATAFWRAVEQRQGEIRGAESYEHDETTFKAPVSKLVGRYYRSSRADFAQAVRELRAQDLPSHRLRAAIEKLEKGLPPIVDFDALVIPDGAENLGLIAPALAFEDIVLTRDPKMLEKISKATGQKNLKPVTLLGGSTWNQAATVTRCEKYCEDAIFVDGYFEASTDAKVRDFVAMYREKMGVLPSLSDAQAYDAAGLLRSLLSAGTIRDREGLQRAIAGHPGFAGVTGVVRFDARGEVQKPLFVLTIRDQTIQLWQPPAPQG